jgi:hypothetical protein
LWDVEAPIPSRQSDHRWRWGSVPRSGRPLPPGKFLVLISVRGWVDPRAIERLERLGQWKNLMTSWEIEPEAFRLVATNYTIACPLPAQTREIIFWRPNL